MPYAAKLPGGATALALLPLVMLTLALVAYSLVRLIRAERSAYLPKWAWALLIILVTPWGAIGYLLLGQAAVVSTGSPPPPAGPPPEPVRVAPAAVGPPVVRTAGLTRD